MAKQANSVFLEEWLKSISGISSALNSKTTSSSAREIIQAWAELRSSLEHQSFDDRHIQTLKTLVNSQSSLYVADPQAKLVISILSSPNFSLPDESYPLFLRILYIWVRKSLRPSLVLVDSSAEVLSQIFSSKIELGKNPLFFSEGVLVLGAISYLLSASEKSKLCCLELLCRLLEEEYQLVGSVGGIIPEVLAGIAYALSSSVNAHVVRLLDSLLGIWGKRLYAKILEFSFGELGALGLLTLVKEHLDSIPFKEAGAIAGVLCSQYASIGEEDQKFVESLVWDYCQDVYSRHRQVGLVLRGREDELLENIEKIAESAFFMVVVFALAVTKEKLDSKYSLESQFDVSVRILGSFSCMEYFRRMRLPDYMDTIRGVVSSIQENESACVSFIESMPTYRDQTDGPDNSIGQKVKYTWTEDEVQTARMLFYLRVIPTCIERVPTQVYRKGYPGITPFEGMASGVAALVRYLPAGSPAIFYCINSLTVKATSLCSENFMDDTDLWKTWQGDLEPSKKILDMLLRLISLVDIQVLPSLMKNLAQLIIKLPTEGQNMVLDQLYFLVSEADDVTRKPLLVSWLQSLSYLCSQSKSADAHSNQKQNTRLSNFAWIVDPLNRIRSYARL